MFVGIDWSNSDIRQFVFASSGRGITSIASIIKRPSKNNIDQGMGVLFLRPTKPTWPTDAFYGYVKEREEETSILFLREWAERYR